MQAGLYTQCIPCNLEDDMVDDDANEVVVWTRFN